MTEGADLIVHPAGRQVMAGVAGDGAGFGEPRLEEQHLAQLDFLWRSHLDCLDGLDRFGCPPRPRQAQRQQQIMFIHFSLSLVAVHNSNLSLTGNACALFAQDQMRPTKTTIKTMNYYISDGLVAGTCEAKKS
ncbi:conserved hypothetical protein [Aeromonas salmonicida]|nr:conserved hypothetical protein [Aeromonas salmonicida]